MTAIFLEDRSIVALSGPEARGFLQGLITNDVEKVGPGRAVYAALLTPQGKILFDFLIAEGDGALLIDCARAGRDALVKRLSMYRLRAKVEIETRDQLCVLANLTHRTIGASAEMPKTALGPEAYLAHRLDLGVPEAGDFGSDKTFALDAGLDELHAVDFEKGCYVGQELTARMKHRGTARKRLLVVDGGQELAAGVELRAGGHSIGEVVSVHGGRGFALVRLDRLDEAAGAAVEADGVRVTVTKQAWLSA